MELNIYAKIVIGLQLFGILLTPFLIGKDRGKHTWAGWIGSIIGLVLILLALGLRIDIKF